MSEILLRHSCSPPPSLSSAKCGDVTPLRDSHNQGDGMGLLEQWPGPSLRDQRHILRNRRPNRPTRLAGWWGQRHCNSVQWGKKKYFVLGRLERPRQNKILLYWHDKPNEPTKEEPLTFVLFESPFTSLSTVSRGHSCLVSLLGIVVMTVDCIRYVTYQQQHFE